MRQLILARDETHRLSIRLALDAAGIPYQASPQAIADGYVDQRRFWVEDADYARALDVVGALDDHHGPEITRRFKIFVAVVSLAIITLWLVLWMTASHRR